MDNNKPTIVVRGYSITDVEEKIIKQVSNERALFNDSAALRQIIREWAEQRHIALDEATTELISQ